MPSDAFVLGGGVGGLVAARRLALEGLSVTLVERSDTLGGQVARQRVAGVDLDAAAESFATRGREVQALLHELGLAGDIVTPRPSPAWLHRADGTAVPLPATGVMGIPGHPLAADVIHAIGLRGAWRARLDTLLPGSRGADAASLGELVRVRMGPAVAEGLVAPVVRGVHSTEIDALPVERAHPRLRTELRERGSLAAAVRALRAAAPAGAQVAGIRGGMFRLVDALAADCARLGVEIELGADVEAAPPHGGTVGGRRRSGLIVTAHAPGADTADRQVTLVTLVVEAPALDDAPRGTGVLVAPGAPRVRARALTHLTAKWSWVADALPGRHALRLSYDGVPDDAIALATADAGILLGTKIERVIDATRHTWARGAAVVDPPPGSVGESAAGTGLAAVVAHADRTARELAASWIRAGRSQG
jgi:oxygen-dependent protoporphyrinogen oxidase